MTAASLLLSYPDWDLALTTGNDVALVSDAFADPQEADGYARAQDAACGIRQFQGENWYDTSQGVPYQQILGRPPSIQVMTSKFNQAALAINEGLGVLQAQTFISSLAGRKVTGQVQLTLVTGQTTASNF